MPPHLHPRSTATSTLFAGTLLASFVVVAIPHLVPCPRPQNRAHLNTEMQFDEHGNPIRRRRKSTMKVETQSSSLPVAAPNTLQGEAAVFQQLQKEAKVLDAEAKERECPVPKPGGVLGKWMGFQRGGE